MRSAKAWTVALKDLAEFRTNRYIMVTLFLMPLLMAVVLPAAYLVPVAMFAPDTPDEPFDLGIVPTQELTGGEMANLTLSDARLVGMNVTDCVLHRCLLIDCQVNGSIVRSSQMNGSVLEGSVVRDCNLLDSSTTGCLVENSVRVGEEDETAELVEMFIDSLLVFFILIPAIIPTVIASYSFVGEKVNRSLEPLLATPTTDLELLLGKVTSIFIPTMGATWIALVPFLLMVNAIASPVLGHAPLPDLVWGAGVLLVAPLVCLMSILANVLVSTRVSDVRASQQIGSLIVLPIVGLFVLSLAGVLALEPLTMGLFALLLLAMDAFLLWAALRLFNREEILVNWR